MFWCNKKKNKTGKGGMGWTELVVHGAQGYLQATGGTTAWVHLFLLLGHTWQLGISMSLDEQRLRISVFYVLFSRALPT